MVDKKIDLKKLQKRLAQMKLEAGIIPKDKRYTDRSK